MAKAPITILYKTQTKYLEQPSVASSPSNILILSKEAEFVEDYRMYASKSALEVDFASNTNVYKYAEGIFNNDRSIRTHKGNVIVYKNKITVEATSGTLTTEDVSARLETISGITNFEFKITVGRSNDGETVRDPLVKDIKKLDFNGKDLNGIAEVIENALSKANLGVSVVASSGKLIFTNKDKGAKSTLLIAPVDSGTGTDFTDALYFNTATAVILNGVDATAGETLVETLKRAHNESFEFAGLICSDAVEDSVIIDISNEIHEPSEEDYEYSCLYFPSLTTVTDVDVFKKLYTEKQQFQTRFFSGTPKAHGYYVSYHLSIEPTLQGQSIRELDSISPFSLGIDDTKTDAYNVREMREIAGQFVQFNNGAGNRFTEPMNLSNATSTQRAMQTIRRKIRNQLFVAQERLGAFILADKTTTATIKATIETILQQVLNNRYISPVSANSEIPQEIFEFFDGTNPDIVADNLRNQGFFVKIVYSSEESMVIPLIAMNIKGNVRTIFVSALVSKVN